ncbi:MAG TPA: FHA domain-containing protein [Candidatus Thermoplasmatota archaeon]|jgi:DNA-binding transcriptional ArsR family regulator|nr:FHA domain-containing protein [Candidatus Thermoplasmatota archaeon]
MARASAGEPAEAPTDTSDLDGLAQYLKVLGNAKRLHLLQFLVAPHYVEEIASELKMARQTAQEHVQQLLDIGVIQRVRGRRDSGPVTEYVVVPQRLFRIHEEFGRLGTLEPETGTAQEMRPPTSPLVTGAAAPREQDLPRLTIVHGMRLGSTMALTGQGPWLVGREPTAAVCLDYDPFISTRHAEVRRAAGGFEVADLYSSNGTWVDWKRLARGGAERVENGAVVRVGKSLLLFRKPA